MGITTGGVLGAKLIKPEEFQFNFRRFGRQSIRCKTRVL
jgi:hypothetical protein